METNKKKRAIKELRFKQLMSFPAIVLEEVVEAVERMIKDEKQIK